MDSEDQQILVRLLQDATSQVYHTMVDRMRKGQPLGQLRDEDGTVSDGIDLMYASN